MVGLSALLMVAAVYFGPPTGSEARRVERDVGRRRVVPRRGVRGDADPADDRRNPRPACVNDAGVIVFPGFPAVDMYEFRLYTFGTQLIVWTTIGLVFAALDLEGAGRQAELARRSASRARE